MRKIKVAYVCVHNSCRSQIAEAITNQFYNSILMAYSGGTHVKDSINQDAINVLKNDHKIDILNKQHPKLIESIPPVDIVITMGCEVDCPVLSCQFREDWGLEDPTGKGLKVMEETVKIISKKIEQLVNRIENKEIMIK